MSRIALFSHAPSDSITALKNELESSLPDPHEVKKLRREGSRFTGRANDVIFNYGSSQFPMSLVGQGIILNNPANIGNASNKRIAIQTMHNHSVNTVEWTTDRSVAQGWFDNGDLVYARTQLQGHSGAGIVACCQNSHENVGGITFQNTLANAQLYTKGITASRREYRVHVFQDKVIYIQKKKRRDGYQGNENYSNIVRNHHTGWIYSNQNAEDINRAGINEALKSITALGLDFGAVDIITRGEEAWVLEVNTAPGMSGTTLSTYADVLTKKLTGEEINHLPVAERLLSQQATRNAQPANVPPTAAPQPAAAQPAPAQAPQTTRSNTPVPPPQPASTARGNGTALTNNGYYWLTVRNERTIGKFIRAQNHFEIIGWEVPVERVDATIISRVSEPQ